MAKQNHHALNHDEHHVSNMLTKIAVGGAVLGAAVILSPYVLPAIGIGEEALAGESIFALHNSIEGSGIAGAINNMLAGVPLIGPQLAGGGFAAAAASATAGIGGVLLGKFIEKHEDGHKSIKWGSVIKWAALATSALIAMPTVLTALGTGIIFLADVVTHYTGNAMYASEAMTLMDSTLGTVGVKQGSLLGLAGLSGMLPHFLTCGAAVLPAAVSMKLAQHENQVEHKDFADRIRHEQQVQNNALSPSNETVAMQVTLPEKLQEGKPTTATITLTHADSGAPLTSDELAVVHTKKLHLLVVDKSLGDYHHIHPEPTGKPGEFAFSFTPATGNSYTAWADLTLINGQNHKLKNELPSASSRRAPLAPITINDAVVVDDLKVTMSLSDPLQQGASSMAEFTVTDRNGKPVTDLEPLMGAYAHLVGFSADGKTLMHSHPMGVEPQNENERGGPKLSFHIEPEASGPTQLYLQVKRKGEEIYLPFGQRVKQPERAVEQLAAKRQQAPGHSHHHM